jgi:inner membrane protein
MSGTNHIAGGLLFTGIFASFWNINIFSDAGLLGLTVLGSVLPDIDHTKSPIGKLFWPLSRYLDTRYGHRTITHSLLFLVFISLFS